MSGNPAEDTREYIGVKGEQRFLVREREREESLSEQDTNVLLVKEETIPRDVWLVEIGDCCGIL